MKEPKLINSLKINLTNIKYRRTMLIILTIIILLAQYVNFYVNIKKNKSFRIS